MKLTDLPLRQRRLLERLQNQTGYMTGSALADYLNVSVRTVRSDLTFINDRLREEGVQVEARPRYGYRLDEKCRSFLNSQSRGGNSWLTREERLRHIVVLLCMQDEPLDLYDLSDSMYISQTTLENDLTALRRTYLEEPGSLALLRVRNTICFAQDERGRRALLCRLYSGNWNYNGRGNRYFDDRFLRDSAGRRDPACHGSLSERGAPAVEDVNMVVLNLMIAIAAERIRAGHVLPPAEAPCPDPASVQAGNAILDRLEPVPRLRFFRRGAGRDLPAYRLQPHAGQQQAALRYAAGVFRRRHAAAGGGLSAQDQGSLPHRPSALRGFPDHLLQFIRSLSLPESNFNRVEVSDSQLQTHLRIELEMAFMFQEFAVSAFGRYLKAEELVYLAFCLSGAIRLYFREMPPLRTVILCQYNLTAAWFLKERVLHDYGGHIRMLALLPMYRKDSYDFSDTDLILTTANKAIGGEYGKKSLTISPLFTARRRGQDRRVHHAVSSADTAACAGGALRRLFGEATWYEHVESESYDEVLEKLIQEQILNGNVTAEYRREVRSREALMPFASGGPIVLVHGFSPARQTHLSVAIMEHRLRKNGSRIRTVLLLTLRPQDCGILFRLFRLLGGSRFSPEDTRHMKTGQEFTDSLLPYFDGD
jgi:lichenan operon transcriptional antiterminator